MKKWSKFVYFIIVAFVLAGCAGSSKYMKLAPDNSSYIPAGNQSLVVFMRPATLGFAIQSSVFDISTGDNKLVGIVSAKKKIAYRTNPGEHMFMVIGESADFMKADLEVGKTYYALVTPRMGAWKARFSLCPVQKKELTSDKFEDWVNSCEYVENTESSYNWATKNAPSIEVKKEKYLKKWDKKPESKKPILNPGDGL